MPQRSETEHLRNESMMKETLSEEAKKIAGTKMKLAIGITVHCAVVIYMIARLFYDIPPPNWMLDAATISYAGFGSIYYLTLIYRLNLKLKHASPDFR
ncbi:MAG: hypothetical protein L3J00_00310 [Thiomicrorhabdus sp.]|nr:hypothetical protein [Thiomicrorhabdus sp.]